MLKYISKDLNLTILLFSIFLNYLFFIPSYFEILIKLNFLIFIFFSIFYLTHNNENKYLTIFIISIVLINLGTPTISWDARSIWIFKAKQIFFENSILHIKYNYAPFSNLQYPNIVPAFSAGFAKLIGHWNEIFPKLGNTLFLIPGFFLFSRFFKNNYFLMLLIFTIFVLGKLLIDGTLDGILSLYFVSCMLIFFKIKYLSYDNYDYILLLAFCIILPLLKLEGIFLLLSILASTLIIFFYKKKINVFLILITIISFIPIILWHLFSFKVLINVTENQNIFNYINFFENILLYENYYLILKYLFLNEKFLLSLSFFIISIFFINIDKKPGLSFVILTVFLYLIILFLVYMSTSLDIEWHLNSSATRVIKPISLLLFVFSIYNIAPHDTKV